MNNPKIIAFYLPQYHEVKENNEWWGQGFTEWVNIKKAKPIFKNHYQPRIPLNENYYDLMNPETFKWQVELADKYGIDAFCFYHYWFNGKLLLEKPLELYLKHKEYIKNYCFSWANEPWARTWDGKNTDVLMPQSYGGKEDIVNHFNYMLPFFNDERYIKIDNKPVFLLYRINSITYAEDMISVWNNLAKDNGFNGIYFVETLSHFSMKKESKNTNATVYFEPSCGGVNQNIVLRGLHKIYRFVKHQKNCSLKYDLIWKSILHENCSETVWGGGFVGWDNTPRKQERGNIIAEQTSEKFAKYMQKKLNLLKKQNCPYLFLNAWNEWCEGAYLEPDVKNGYKYLEAIKNLNRD